MADSHLALFDQQRRKWKEEKSQLMKRVKELQENLDEVTQNGNEERDQLMEKLKELQENLDEVTKGGCEERDQLMERLKDLQEDLVDAEQQVVNLKAESKVKEEHVKELEESFSRFNKH